MALNLKQVAAWCKQNGYTLCDNLDIDCSCEVTHIDNAKGYKGRTFKICSNCYTTRCSVCHNFCDETYIDECYECNGECDNDEVVCSYRNEYRIRIYKDDFFFEKYVSVHHIIDEKTYNWKEDTDVVNAILEYYNDKRKRPKESSYYDSIVDFCLDTADKEIKEI